MSTAEAFQVDRLVRWRPADHPPGDGDEVCVKLSNGESYIGLTYIMGVYADGSPNDPPRLKTPCGCELEWPDGVNCWVPISELGINEERQP